MSTWSILIISAGFMAADGPHLQSASRDVAAAPGICAPAISDTGVARISDQGVARVSDTRMTLAVYSSQEDPHIQQTGYSQACAAPACCAPAACTPVSCAAAALPGCGNGCTSNYCCTSDCCEQSCCDRCMNRCRWHRAHSTADMFPHFAYYPEHHGYYYFRPYNWTHVLEHQSRILGMGGDSRNPYSVAMFDVIYEDFEERFPPIVDPPAGSVRPLGSHLPNLEDLLND